MAICLITYEAIPDGQKYSPAGLRKLSTRLTMLRDLPYSAEEQRQEAKNRAGKISVQGVQPKFSARLSERDSTFAIVDKHGHYIVKPQSNEYAQLPENEDLTMHLAATVGIECPVHGLVSCTDGSLSYFVRRFDRPRRTGKIHVEDFAQLTGKSRDTKYDSSMEQVAEAIAAHCTFPLPELVKLFRRTLFCLLTGNEDMHLKNFTVMHNGDMVTLSPAYDMVNTTLVLGNATREELALPLHGKKSRITPRDLLDYYACERLELPPAVVGDALEAFRAALPVWHRLIERSFLSEESRASYRALLDARVDRFLN
jgi:serine/threonine-protein kinase HipA